MTQVPIDTERLRLERWAEAHTALLVELSADPRVTRHIALGATWPASLAEDASERQRSHWAEHGFGWRAAVEKATGEAIGFAALNFLGEGAAGLAADEYEIGWWLKPSAWGKGFAVEAAGATLVEAFGRVGAVSVIARIQPSNAPSIRVARALGLALDVSTTGSQGEPVEIFRLRAEAFEP